MSGGLSKIFMIVFAVAALVGWAVAANLFFRVMPPIAVEDAELVSVASTYARNLTEAQAEGARFERVEAVAAGEALAAIQAQKAAEPAPLPNLSYVDGDFTLRYRVGNNALVEGVYEVEDGSEEIQIIELFNLTYDADSGRWKVTVVQRVEFTPEGPVVPSEASPTPVPVPTPLPSQSIEPAAPAPSQDQ